MNSSGNWTSRFAVRGVFWRQYLDWATINMPFYTYPVLHCFMTFFFFFFAAPARRIVLANLAIILPGSSRAVNYLRVLRTFYNYAWTISEAAIHKLNKEEFAYEIIGAQWLDQLGAAPGAIVLTAHMGNYDLGAALFAEKFNREIRLVRAPEPDQQTAQHLSASLEKSGEGAVKVDYNTAGALLSFDLLNALRLGEIVSIQGDRMDGDLAETPAHLFGHDVRLPNGPFVLAQVAARADLSALHRPGGLSQLPDYCARTDSPFCGAGATARMTLPKRWENGAGSWSKCSRSAGTNGLRSLPAFSPDEQDRHETVLFFVVPPDRAVSRRRRETRREQRI